jgi:c-di-GMP-binding flagellar brake protein YcgR
VNEFLQSLARAFEQNRDALPWLARALPILLALALAALLVHRGHERQARRSRERRYARERGLTASDVALAAELARHASAELHAFLTRVDVFELATARALAGPVRHASGDDLPARIGRLRRLLGFAAPVPHRPLLTTRELEAGTAIEVGSSLGQATRVDEASFSVALAQPLALSVGEKVTLRISHGREARYALRCALVSSRAEPAGAWQLEFAHDEAPERIQMREYVRVPLRGEMELRPIISGVGVVVEDRTVHASLLDLSAGGARVASESELVVGRVMRVSFDVGDSHFAEMRAEVLSSAASAGGLFRAQLEFRGLTEPDRDRLVSALAREELSLEPRDPR